MGIKTLSFHLSLSADPDLVWQQLENLGCMLLYSDSDETSAKIYGNLPENLTKEQLLIIPNLLAIEEIELPDIDWEAQWSSHEEYSDGFLQVDLQSYGQSSNTIKMIPGPGFGDHSHPTTRLVLRLMPSFVLDKDVIDVGCGSGILSLAAKLMGARSVCGIDIDEAALRHAGDNAACNGMNIHFTLPSELKTLNKKTVILMNMIQSEQEIAWESLATISENVSTLVTSGILYEGREDYLKFCEKKGWLLLKEAEEEGWLGFVLRNGALI